MSGFIGPVIIDLIILELGVGIWLIVSVIIDSDRFIGPVIINDVRARVNNTDVRARVNNTDVRARVNNTNTCDHR